MSKQGRFSIRMPKDKLAQLLALCYKFTVEKRGGTYAVNAELKECIQKVAAILCGEDRRFGVMFVGNVGNGKTTMMKAVQLAMQQLVHARMYDYGFGLRIVKAKDIQRDEHNPGRFQTLCAEPLLGIDDLGCEPRENMSYGNVATPMIDLLEYRYDRQLLTFITTNLTRQMRQTVYGERIADRFNEMFANIVFKNKSYR